MKAKYDPILGQLRESDEGSGGFTPTNAQRDAMNSGITAEKVATYDGYATGKADLGGNGRVIPAQMPVANESSIGAVRTHRDYGFYTVSGSGSITLNNNTAKLDSRNQYHAVTGSTLDYAVRSVSPLVTGLPADAASPIALTDAMATTRNHSYTYTHAPSTAPTYKLPAVSDATITHEIILYLDLTSTASFSFTDSEGATIAVDTNGVTPAIGEKWTVWAEYAHGAWVVRGMKDMEATA